MLVVPHIGKLQDADLRLVQLAELLGVCCRTLPIDSVSPFSAEHLSRAVGPDGSCLVVNSGVFRTWLGGDDPPPEIFTFLLSRFPFLIVHGFEGSAFDATVLAGLSGGRLGGLSAVEDQGGDYEVAADSVGLSGPFAGLCFGPINSTNDRVFQVSRDSAAVSSIISINGRPLMTLVQHNDAKVLFVGSEDVADLTAQAIGIPLTKYFSKLMPYAMALRYVAGEESWQPYEGYASVSIDDPLLRQDYGFMNVGSLVQLMDRYNFSTTIGFIPRNYRRNSQAIADLFRENPSRLAICYHGNDHLKAELGASDTSVLNEMIGTAVRRMDTHYQSTGLSCDNVMVFPQGHFSTEAMSVLKAHNFSAAVNTITHPMNGAPCLTLAELAQPSVPRYEGFPLFIRRSVRQLQIQDVAFNMFFGRPTLIGEHHDIFQNPTPLVELVTAINSMRTKVRWAGLGDAVNSATLQRQAADGTLHVRAYSGTVRVNNDGPSGRQFTIEWVCPRHDASVEMVLKDGAPCFGFDVHDGRVRVSVAMPARSFGTFSVVHRKLDRRARKPGLRHEAEAFLRRRLSEVRDNHVAKYPRAQGFAKRVGQFVLQRSTSQT